MSLQARLLASIAALLLLALLSGGVALVLHARAAVRSEIQTAMRGAQDSVRDTLAGDVRHTITARQIIAGFNGQRHLRLSLLNERGRIIVSSEPAPPLSLVPGWFARLIAPEPARALLPINLPRYPCVLLLRSDPQNELVEVWNYASDAFATMLLFCAATWSMVWLILGRTLRFVPQFQRGLRTVSDGDYDARLAAGGPPEFAALAQGFNHMAERLAAYRRSNQRLQQQLLTLQEEERAEIARDLHDEVGPYLFAIQVDADAVAKAGTKAGDDATRERAGAIRDAALHIQRHVKAILRQLRPVNSLDFGLPAAVADLVAFWSRRHPHIAFETGVGTELGLDRRGEETAFRLVQESVSNAVRHGHPGRVHITIARDGGAVRVCIEDDGGGLKGGSVHDGLGLKGMAERVRALNGDFSVENMPGGARVRARLPAARETEPA